MGRSSVGVSGALKLPKNAIRAHSGVSIASNTPKNVIKSFKNAKMGPSNDDVSTYSSSSVKICNSFFHLASLSDRFRVRQPPKDLKSFGFFHQLAWGMKEALSVLPPSKWKRKIIIITVSSSWIPRLFLRNNFLAGSLANELETTRRCSFLSCCLRPQRHRRGRRSFALVVLASRTIKTFFIYLIYIFVVFYFVREKKRRKRYMNGTYKNFKLLLLASLPEI